MSAKLSACQKMHKKKSPKKVLLEYDFGGIKAGQTMFVGTPLIVDGYIKKIPYAETRTIRGLRNEMARNNKCDASCPVSTSIFIRMVAEASIEEMNEGKQTSEVAPFWRLLTSEDKITKKLPIDPQWVDRQRELEQENS